MSGILKIFFIFVDFKWILHQFYFALTQFFLSSLKFIVQSHDNIFFWLHLSSQSIIFAFQPILLRISLILQKWISLFFCF